MDDPIAVDGLTKRYGRTLAVDGLSFRVLPGRVTGFVGPNGAGKSTTMRLVLGLDRPSSGRALVGGTPYASVASPLRTVGALLDPQALHPGRSAYDHLTWLAQSNGLPRGRVRTVMEWVGLEPVARRRAGGFSLGMKQRLGIAAALLGDPPLLMLDEPVNGLDPEGIRWMRGFLRSLAAEGRAVFVSSHLMSELEGVADHLVVIGRGRLLADAPVGDLLARASRGSVVLRVSARDTAMTVLARAGASVVPRADGALVVSGLSVERVGELAAAHGLGLQELAPLRASLEEVFLELTRDATEYVSNDEGRAT